jgi:hypothetical protein
MVKKSSGDQADCIKVINNVLGAPCIGRGRMEEFLRNHVVRRRGDNQGFSDHIIKKISAEQIFIYNVHGKVAIKKGFFFITQIDREVV